MSFIDKTVGWLAPNECLGCGSEGSCLCLFCQEMEIIQFGERCFICNKVSPGARTCKHCRISSPTHCWIATEYLGVAKDLVRATKYSHKRDGSKNIADILARTLEEYIDLDELQLRNYIFVPIPTATSRLRERGFDHTLLIAKHLSKVTSLPIVEAIRRIGQTRQVGAKREIRIRQMEGALLITKPQLVKGKNIILIDDVVTTGATLRAATKILRKTGAKTVNALVFSKRL